MKPQILALGFLSLFGLSEARADGAWPFFFDHTQRETQVEVLREWKHEGLSYDLNGKTVKSCAEFVLASGGMIWSEVFSQQAEAIFPSCMWLSLLARAKPPQQILFSHDDISRDMSEYLDVGSLPWQIQSGGTPSDLSKKRQIKLSLKGAEMTFKGKYRDSGAEMPREYAIQFLASADFDGSGKESVVALYNVSDLSGNQRGVESGTVLLTRSEANGPIIAKPFMVMAP